MALTTGKGGSRKTERVALTTRTGCSLRPEYSVAWTAEAYYLPLDGSIEFELKWERLYGELPAGTYRIVKGFMDFRGPGDYDSATFLTEFEITE